MSTNHETDTDPYSLEESVTARVTTEEKEIILAAVALADTNLSKWARACIVHEAKRQVSLTTEELIHEQAAQKHDEINAEMQRRIEALKRIKSS